MKKFWQKLSITRKIFVCTAAMFSAVLLLLLFGQLFFFEKYYYFSTESNLQNSLNDFSESYYKSTSNEEIKQNITDFSDMNNAFIFIMDKRGNILHMSSYYMYIENSGEIYHVLLDNAVYDNEFMSLKLEEDTEITVIYSKDKSITSKQNVIIPQKIIYGDKTWTSEKTFPRIDIKNLEIYSITGTISSLYIPSKTSSKTNIRKNEAYDAILSLRQNGSFVSPKEEFNKYNYISPESNSKYCIVSYNPENHDEYIFAVKPLQSISEAVYILKDTLLLWFLCILIIALIVSIIFSKSVTKPIIKITEITKKIKNLDFSAKCDITSHDEVGLLAENINDMSEKLNGTINELLKANLKLQNDIEHERILEEQRKEFIAVISHELKTPLGIIRAYSEGLIDGVAYQEKYLNVIVEETKKMDKLILEMLEDSKLETGNQQLELKFSDFCEFYNHIIKNFKEAFLAKNITLIENISPEPVYKNFDKDLMERVLSNFISNAMRYSENKKIIISIDKDTFSIENEGDHIAEEDLTKIWEKFYRVGNSTKHFTGGTGLGLSIAKNILTLHNADFGVVNTAIGVKFWFKLKN